MNNHGIPAFATHPANPLGATPPGSPAATPAATPVATPEDSPRTPVGAAHAILQAALPPPLHPHGHPGHGHPALLHPAFVPPAFVPPAFVPPAFVPPAFVLPALAQAPADIPAPAHAAADGLGDLAALFPGLPPVNVGHNPVLMAPATPAPDNQGAGILNLIALHTPQPAAPHAGAGLYGPFHGPVHGAFHGALLPLFNEIANQEELQALQPPTPDAPTSVGSVVDSTASEVTQPGSPESASSVAGPSNWWQR